MFVVLVAEMNEGGLDLGEERFKGGNGAFLWRVSVAESTGFCGCHYGRFYASEFINLRLEFDVQVCAWFCKKTRAKGFICLLEIDISCLLKDDSPSPQVQVLGNELIRLGIYGGTGANGCRVRVSQFVSSPETVLHTRF